MLKKYDFTESTIGGSKYLYHDLNVTPAWPEHREIIRTHLEKLHVVPYTIQMPDGSDVACYDLGAVHHGLISLTNVFHTKRPIKMEELILLMHGIVGTIIYGLKQGLNENSFVLDPKHVYMKRNSTQAQLIYLPMAVEMPLSESFAGLMKYLSTVYDDSNPLTKQILTALINVATSGFNHRDITNIVVQAANKKTVDPRYLTVQPKQEEPKGLFKRLIGSVTGKDEGLNYENPFADIDERTIISMTDASNINLNVAALYVLENETRIMQILIDKDAYVLGRKRDEVDFAFDDKGISRVHASIVFDGRGYFVTDKGSSGGTFINQKRLTPGEPTEIKNGDTLQLYTRKMIFEYNK